MTKNTANKILIPLMTLLAVNQALTAIFSDEMPHEAFEILHQGGGVIFIIFIAVHIALNFNWVKANYFNKRHGT